MRYEKFGNVGRRHRDAGGVKTGGKLHGPYQWIGISFLSQFRQLRHSVPLARTYGYRFHGFAGREIGFRRVTPAIMSKECVGLLETQSRV